MKINKCFAYLNVFKLLLMACTRAWIILDTLDRNSASRIIHALVRAIKGVQKLKMTDIVSVRSSIPIHECMHFRKTTQQYQLKNNNTKQLTCCKKKFNMIPRMSRREIWSIIHTMQIQRGVQLMFDYNNKMISGFMHSASANWFNISGVALPNIVKFHHI